MAYTPEQETRLRQLLRPLGAFGQTNRLIDLLLAPDQAAQLSALLDQELAKVAAVKAALPALRADQDVKIAADEKLLAETKTAVEAAANLEIVK
jgi:hypothetical protein